MWIHIPLGSALYRNTVSDLTLPSLLADLWIATPLKQAAAIRVGGEPLVGISGNSETAALLATLYTNARGLPLPVKEVLHAARGGRASIVLSRWNESVGVTVPATSTRFAPTSTA